MRPRVLLVKCAPKADRPSVAPPIGVLSLAATLQARLSAEVRILDAGFSMYGAAPPPVAEFSALVREFAPHVVGLSALTCERECLEALAQASKAAAPTVPVVVGGPYPTAEPLAWRSCAAIDCAVLGEGDEVFPTLVEHLLAGSGIPALQGVLGRSGDSRGVAQPVADLDALPPLPWELLDLPRYAHSRYRNQTGLPAHHPYAALCTSRGCPYRCSYCHDVHGKRFRAMSPERVLADVERLAARGIREVHFVDDIFNFDLPRAKAIFAGMAKRRPRMRIGFPNGLRADRLDQEFCDMAAAAGTWYAAVAVETASPRLQKLIHKHLNLDKVAQSLRWLNAAGIRTRSFVMLGFPTETEAEMEQTIRFVVDSDTAEASFFNVVPYPGSHLHELAEGVAPGLADSTTLAPFYSEESFYDKATGRSLARIRDKAILRFYLSRGRFLKVLWRTPLRFWCSRAFLATVGYFGARAVRAMVPPALRGRRTAEATS